MDLEGDGSQCCRSRTLGTCSLALLAENPALRADLTLTDRSLDIAAEGLDLAIRVGTNLPGDMVPVKDPDSATAISTSICKSQSMIDHLLYSILGNYRGGGAGKAGHGQDWAGWSVRLHLVEFKRLRCAGSASI